MSEFLNGFGLICATAAGAFAVAFGLYAGWQAVVWTFGPLNIAVKVNDINVNTKHAHGPKFEGEA